MPQLDDIKVSDRITNLERAFPFPDLLALDYFKRYRDSYYDCRDNGWQLGTRNYGNLLSFFSEIHAHREDDAKGFAKLFRGAANELNNSEAYFAEVIVYRYYIRLVSEGIIRDVRLGRSECDVIVERLDGMCAYLEVFSIKPHFDEPEPGESPVNEYKSHLQIPPASIRQKLLRKIAKQNQMTKVRDNYAVIELNDASIAGDFALMSSLSDGYKVTIDLTTMQRVGSGYDWSKSVFDNEATRNLKGVIWFDLGDYPSRRILMNPTFTGTTAR